MYNKYVSTFKIANKVYRLVLIPEEDSSSFFEKYAEFYDIDPESDFSDIGRIWKLIDSLENEALILQFYGNHASQFCSKSSSVFIPDKNYFGIIEAAVKYAIKNILKVLY